MIESGHEHGENTCRRLGPASSRGAARDGRFEGARSAAGALTAWCVLVNPDARRGRRALRRVRELLAARAPATTPELRFVAMDTLDGLAEAPERLVVIGGDGSINRAVEWLWRRGATCPLAVVPGGTGNNLARGLGVPLDVPAALRLALEGTDCRPLDVVTYTTGEDPTQRVFVQSGALGFPAEVAARYDRLRRRRLWRLALAPLGPYVYRLLALGGLASQRARERRGDVLRVTVRTAGERLEEDVVAVFLGNERSLGGNFHPCPLAKIDDGAVDVCLLRAGTGASYLRTFRRIVRGEHLDLSETVVYRQTAGPLELTLSRPARLLADGDLWVSSSRYRFLVAPACVSVVVSS